MPAPKRRSFIADKQVQGTLVVRLVMYWCLAWLAVLTLAIVVAAFFGLAVEGVSVWDVITRMLNYFWLPILVSVMVLPILVRDCIRLSNRFTGPVLRLRRGLKALASGEAADRITLRKGDFWQETADDFNRVLEMMEEFQNAKQA